MVLGLLGLTIFLRWEYSLFGDPVGPLIFAVMFLFGDLVQKFLRVLSEIKVHAAVRSHQLTGMPLVLQGEAHLFIVPSQALLLRRLWAYSPSTIYNIVNTECQHWSCQFSALF